MAHESAFGWSSDEASRNVLAPTNMISLFNSQFRIGIILFIRILVNKQEVPCGEIKKFSQVNRMLLDKRNLMQVSSSRIEAI